MNEVPWKGRNHSTELSETERFFEKVNKTDGCWLWVAAKCQLGYGLFNYGDGTKAHRWSYKFHYGNLPDNQMVLHKCDVRNCVNPHHLYLGTQKENMRDCRDRGRNYVPDVKGEKNPMAVLNYETVALMRKIRENFKTPYKKIGSMFGVSAMTAYRAIVGKAWK
jgi:hypothetical protein